MAVDKIFHELDAPKFHKLSVGLNMPIERHAHCPGTGKHVGVINRHVVLESFRATSREPLDDVETVAVEVTGLVEPGHTVETSRGDHQRVAIPPPSRSGTFPA